MMYVNQINILYTWSLYSAACQLHFNKTVRKKKELKQLENESFIYFLPSPKLKHPAFQFGTWYSKLVPDRMLKLGFSKICLHLAGLFTDPNIHKLSDRLIKNLLPFLMMYNCKLGFSMFIS